MNAISFKKWVSTILLLAITISLCGCSTNRTAASQDEHLTTTTAFIVLNGANVPALNSSAIASFVDTPQDGDRSILIVPDGNPSITTFSFDSTAKNVTYATAESKKWYKEICTSIIDARPDDADTDLFNGLKKLYRNGLLQNEVQKPTFLHDEPGTALFLFPCPIGHSFLPILFYKLLQWLWFPLLVLTAVVVTINGGLSSLPPLSGYSALLPPAALLFNIVLHELSHAWAGSSFGIPADAFGVGVYRFLPFGAAFFSLLPYATVSADVGISVAGPLANLFAGSVALLLAISSQSSDSLYLAVCSYTLGCINLLPIPGFDGVSLHDMFPHQLKIGFGTVLCGLAANWAVLAVGYALCFLPWWVSFLIVLVLTVMAALLLPSRHSVCWARMLSTFCLLPVMIKSLGFELLAVSLPTAILNIGFCLLLSYLTAPVLLELIFVSYLYQK